VSIIIASFDLTTFVDFVFWLYVFLLTISRSTTLPFWPWTRP
jgi:hypothetical protein